VIGQRPRLRVLVVEDSPVARRLIVHILNEDPDLEVVAEAADGHEAVVLTARYRPDVIVMDVVMPTMNGLEATRRIMAQTPTPIVLVTAGYDPEDGMSFDALQAGALVLLAKPPGPQASTFSQETATFRMTVKLMAEVKLVRRRAGRRPPPAAASLTADASPVSAPGRAVEIVAIAASTGGPAALATILGDLPATTPVPVLVVQHITAGFHHGLVSWLASVSKLEVRLATDGQPLRPGQVLVAPSDAHLGVNGRGRVALSSDPPIGGHRPSATHLFRSVAKGYGSAAVAAILTGMGDDGVAGLRALKEAGGLVLAQDESTSVVYGMPREAAVLGVVDRVLPVGQVAGALTSAWNGGRSR
jgi:two-component system, chemotaxis family, protein-glutamate methylesterase/glutaminase